MGDDIGEGEASSDTGDEVVLDVVGAGSDGPPHTGSIIKHAGSSQSLTKLPLYPSQSLLNPPSLQAPASDLPALLQFDVLAPFDGRLSQSVLVVHPAAAISTVLK